VESAQRRAAAAEQKKTELGLAKTRAAEKAARSYDNLFNGGDEDEESAAKPMTVQEMEDDFM